MKITPQSRVVWPLLALSGTALISTAAGVLAQNQPSPTNLPQPPKITNDAPPPPAPEAGPLGPQDGPPPPPDGPGLDGPRPEGRPAGRRGAVERPAPMAGRGPIGRPGFEGGPGPLEGPEGGPRHRGPRPTPPDANTEAGAAKSLERAYRAAGEVGTVDNEAREVSNLARSLYAQSMTAYNAKNYERAFRLAEGSERLSRTADGLMNANGKPLPAVAGLTPPPVVKTAKANGDQGERSARELNRAFHEANEAAHFDNPLSKQLSGKAETNYKLALTAYNAKRYDEAERRARLGAELGKAAREYGETLS